MIQLLSISYIFVVARANILSKRYDKISQSLYRFSVCMTLFICLKWNLFLCDIFRVWIMPFISIKRKRWWVGPYLRTDAKIVFLRFLYSWEFGYLLLPRRPFNMKQPLPERHGSTPNHPIKTTSQKCIAMTWTRLWWRLFFQKLLIGTRIIDFSMVTYLQACRALRTALYW